MVSVIALQIYYSNRTKPAAENPGVGRVYVGKLLNQIVLVFSLLQSSQVMLYNDKFFYLTVQTVFIFFNFYAIYKYRRL